MNKIKRILICAMLSYGSANAESIIYNGLECELEPAEPFKPAQSKFEATYSFGDGNYLLRITNGIPVFKNHRLNDDGTLSYEDTYRTCVGRLSDTSGTDDHGAVRQVDAIYGTANINNGTLIITFSTIYQEDFWITDSVYASGLTSPSTQTLIFEFNESRQSFVLKNAFIQSSAVRSMLFTSPPDYVQITSLGTPRHITPSEEIEFVVTQP
ncbi:MAG: hypothetical protein KDE66_05115 [Nitrosomonas sp.]|nr:hypothetical protein [Nitrosomonas sp.]